MKKARSNLLFILLFCLPFACRNNGQVVAKESQMNAEADVAAIKALVADWVRLYNAGDFDRIMSVFYTKDAVLLSPNAPIHRGADAIRLSFQKDSQLYDEHVDSSIVEDVRISGDLAVARGADTGTTTPKNGGKPDKYTLKWVMVFERQADGAWKCIAEIWNEDAPPSMPAK